MRRRQSGRGGSARGRGGGGSVERDEQIEVSGDGSHSRGEVRENMRIGRKKGEKKYGQFNPNSAVPSSISSKTR